MDLFLIFCPVVLIYVSFFFFFFPVPYSLVAQMVKNLPAMQETWVLSMDWEFPLEKRKATHSRIMAWRIPWTVWSMGSQSQTWLSNFHFHHTLFYTVALFCSLSSWRLISPAPFFFLKNTLAIWGLLCVHTHF